MTIQTYPAPKSQVTSSFWRYTATGGETTLTGIDNAGVQLAYLPGQEQVYLNGVMLMRGTDYTATNGTSIVGLSALTASDYVQVITYSNFTVTNIPVGSISGAITNLQLANSTFTLGSTLINLGDTKNTIAGLTLTSPTINNPIVGTGYSTSVPLTVKGATGQAVNLQEWNINGGTAVAVLDFNGKFGIGTSPTSVPSIGSPGSGKDNLVIYNAGNVGISLITDSASTRTQSYNFGAAGINVPDASMSYDTNSRGMYFNIYGNSEAMRISSTGNVSIGGLTPDTYNPNTSYNKVLDVRQADQVLTLGSYWQSGVGQNSYINSSQSTSATNASNLIFQTGRTEAMRIDTSQNVMVGTTTAVGKFTVAGALSTTTFSPDQTLTLSALTTYSANTYYNLGTFPVSGGGEVYICQLLIQFDNLGYHNYTGTFIISPTIWKNAGTLVIQTFQMEQHNGNNATGTIRLNVSNTNRSIDFQTDQSIAITTGGFVTLKMKRIF